MKVKFSLPLEPFSVNRMHTRDKAHKSQDYRDWEIAAIQALRKQGPQTALAQIRDAFKPESHGLVVWFKFLFPAKVLFNKAGLISSRAEDLSNVEKPLLDILFLPKYHVQPMPWGAPNVNADDKYVLRLTSTKALSPDDAYHIEVRIATVPLVRPAVGP